LCAELFELVDCLGGFLCVLTVFSKLVRGEITCGRSGDLIASMFAIPLFLGLNLTAIVLLGVIGEKSDGCFIYLSLLLEVSTVRPGGLLIEDMPPYLSCY
jgi:hypothetical protein